jgi:hypothetical protein
MSPWQVLTLHAPSHIDGLRFGFRIRPCFWLRIWFRCRLWFGLGFQFWFRFEGWLWFGFRFWARCRRFG